ncbi:MAG: LppX_LprAFG lipoprotein [Thermoleophilia bacterium]
MLTTTTERRVLRPLAFVALVLLLFTALLSGGCSSDDDETVDAAAVLAESTTAMEALQSFHFTYNVTKPADASQAEGFEVVRIVGDVTTEGNMQATIDMLQGGVPLQVEFVAAGATHYVQDPTTQKWQGVPAAFSPVGSLNLSAGTIQVLKRIVDPSYAATEDVGGSPAYHLTGEVAAADVAAIAGSTTSEKPFEGEVWVGVDDHLVKRIVIAGAATENEVDGTVRTIELSDFDKPVEIVPPQ